MLSNKYAGGNFPEGARFTKYRAEPGRTQTMTKRFINDKTLATTARIVQLATELDVSPVSFAVAWTLSHDFVGSTIVGATRVEQVDELLRGSSIKLSAEVLAKVDAITSEILYPMG